MSSRHAVLTLYPVYLPDALPFRSLTFASESDKVSIGRSSKCESKNLFPSHNNGWFESRVMSRDHARFGVSLQKETIYIRDNGSMHGTSLNDKKIPTGKDIPIHSGDILTFGNEVTRGSETFPPLKVRCECQWFNESDKKVSEDPLKAPLKRAKNSFSVPEDDDEDVVEIVRDSGVKKVISFTVPDSDDDSDSDSVRPLEQSTPATSPLSKDGIRGCSSTEAAKLTPKPYLSKYVEEDSDIDEGTQQTPIIVDEEQPLVTPTMTPPPAVHTPGAYPIIENKINVDIADGDSDSESMQVSVVGEDSDVESENWEGDEDHPSISSTGEDSESHASEGSEDEEDADTSSVGSSPQSSAPYEPTYAHSEIDVEEDAHSVGLDMERSRSDNANIRQSTDGDYTIHVPFGRSASSNGDAFPTPRSPPSGIQGQHFQNTTRLNGIPYNPVQYQNDWASGTRSDRLHSQPYKTAEKPFIQPLNYTCGSFVPSFEEWAGPPGSGQASQLPLGPFSSAPLGNSFNSYTGYADGPFMLGQSRSSAPNVGSASSIALPGPASLVSLVGQCSNHPVNEQRLKDMPSCNNVGKPTLPSFAECANQTAKVSDDAKSAIGPENQSEKPAMESTATTTRVSIADIVHECKPETEQKTSLKRKAADMELESLSSVPSYFGGFSEFSHCAESLGDGNIASVFSDVASSLPDAQPQIPVKEFDSSSSQLTKLSTAGESELSQPGTSEGEPRRKRVKISNDSRPRNLTRDAVFALGGVVMGSILTVAGLASLPPDFFN